MDEYDDEVLQIFVTESREHLDTIEADLLRMEEGGTDIDEELVNKVFRAAHSIKGGSGFFGLGKVKELAHKSETVLDMIRSRRMAPNAEVVNLLLASFDKLRELVNNTKQSEEADIAELLASLVSLASSYLPANQKASLCTQVTLQASGNADGVVLPQTDTDRIARTGLSAYLVDCDLIHDVEQKGLNVMTLFGALIEQGEILDCEVDYAAVGTLDEPVGKRLPLRIVVASALNPEALSALFGGMDITCIRKLEPAPVGTVPVVLSPVLSAMAKPAFVGAAPSPATPPAAPPSVPPAEAPAVMTACPDPSPSASSVKPESQMAATETTDETLRVNVRLLETLMDLTSELVLSRNQLRAAVASNNHKLLSTVDQRVNQITTELQDVIMETRLQPIGNVFTKFPRLVRDLSRSLGKEIRLEIEGRDIALDKTLIEGLSDPLTHMVRNSVDHGIENPEERIRAGKPPMGTVRIDARHEAGLVVVEIRDDGKGIDPVRIAEAAVSRGLLSAEKALGLSDKDKRALIFLPGLSTAEKLSDVSGRGVGMDVVKTNLDRLGGQVEIESEVGEGSTFRIKLPLTLAIIPSLIVSVDGERFAIPQANIEELLHLRPEDAQNRMEIVGDSEVLLLRDRMLPLARFGDILGIIPFYTDPATGKKEISRRDRLADRRSRRYAIDGKEAKNPPTPLGDVRNEDERRHASTSALEIAVVTTGMMSYGLVVGGFHDTEEVVVKPLGRRFRCLREYSGATILGDGSVALILDVAGLALKAGLSSVSGSARAEQVAAKARQSGDTHSLMLFQNGPGEPCCVPLDLVRRIERVSPDRVERLGSYRTMQYRGGTLPLIALSDAASLASLDGEPELVVLVANMNGREVGLLGSMPVDIVNTDAVFDQTSHRQKGIAGAAIIGGRTTLVVDLYELAETIHPEWATERTVAGSVSDASSFVLLAEDSDFFRTQVKHFLEEDGLAVLAAADGEAAWELLLKNLGRVRVVVTDIEMPRLTGLGLAARIRGDQRTTGLPVIAVTSLAGDEDAARGAAVGITEYQVKLDRDTLLESVRKYIPVQGEVHE